MDDEQIGEGTYLQWSPFEYRDTPVSDAADAIRYAVSFLSIEDAFVAVKRVYDEMRGAIVDGGESESAALPAVSRRRLPTDSLQNLTIAQLRKRREIFNNGTIAFQNLDDLGNEQANQEAWSRFNTLFQKWKAKIDRELQRRGECPKCHQHSGDDWSQCKGSCPMPMSPHYVAPKRPQ